MGCHLGFDHPCGSRCAYPSCRQLPHLSDPGDQPITLIAPTGRAAKAIKKMRSQPWESCPVADQRCMSNECTNGCSLTSRYEDVFNPDGTYRKRVAIPSPKFGSPVGPWHRAFAWRPVKSYDDRLIWLCRYWRRRIQSHDYLHGPMNCWWQCSLDNPHKGIRP